jgi:hypothetical protein
LIVDAIEFISFLCTLDTITLWSSFQGVSCSSIHQLEATVFQQLGLFFRYFSSLLNTLLLDKSILTSSFLRSNWRVVGVDSLLHSNVIQKVPSTFTALGRHSSDVYRSWPHTWPPVLGTVFSHHLVACRIYASPECFLVELR